MGWRFRHSFKVIPGVRLNLSKSGLSASIGGAPFTLNVNPHGVYGTASIPGTGISFRERIGGGSSSNNTQDFIPPNSLPSESVPSVPIPSLIPLPTSTPIEYVRSGSTELMTSESLKELKRVLQAAYEEHQDISCGLATARDEESKALTKYLSWADGFLFKRLFKIAFAKRKADSDTASARVQELEDQLRLTKVATQIEIGKEQAEPYFRMRYAFTALLECAAIWDVKSHQAIDRFHERTTATRRVDRGRVKFSLASCDLLQWDQKVPHLQNLNGGDLFLYPGFILYRASKQAFSVIDFHDVRVTATFVNFQEEQAVPADAQVVGQTWARANKDGSRDKRFAGNYQIPIVRYAALILKSETGLWEEFQFSNPERLQRFLDGWSCFVSSFGERSTATVN
jgi:hypothetical protein